MRNMTLQASSIPGWSIQKAVIRLRELDIPIKQTTLVRAAIAGFIGLDDNAIRDFAVKGARVSHDKHAASRLDDMLREMEIIS